MSIYRKFILPHFTDLAMRNQRLEPYRERVIRAAEGRVLEIGAGSGLNLNRYGATVREVFALEPDPQLIRMATHHSRQSLRPIKFLGASAEEIPLEKGSIDSVVSTWTLCTIPDAHRALEEVRRVLKPGGRFLFVEHGLAPEAGVRKWQHRLDPLWIRVSGGCHLDRPIGTMIARSGLEIEQLQTAYIPGPKIMAFLYEGSARPS